jgi:transposase
MSVKNKLSAQEQLRILLEGLKDNVKIAEICRREELWPKEYYRIREKALSGALEALKNSRKKKDVEKAKLKKETERLKDIILSQAEEINLLKKKTNWDY